MFADTTDMILRREHITATGMTTENENKEKTLCHRKPESLSFVAIPKRFRVAGTLKYSKSCSPLTSSIIRPNRVDSPRIATALEIYIARCALHFLIFTQRSIGRFPTVIG